MELGRRFFTGRVVGVVVLIALLAAAYLVISGPKGEYAYRCADGTEFSMTPADDISSITFYPGRSAAPLEDIVLNHVMTESGARFESGNFAFYGKGETVQLIGTSLSTMCTPVPNALKAPFNWGD